MNREIPITQDPVDVNISYPGLGSAIGSLPKRTGRIAGIFKQPGLWAKLDFLFWRTLCPMPDQTRLGMWWYGKSSIIAGFFHAKHCSRCRENVKRTNYQISQQTQP